jgi:hypothetical protein
MLLSLLTGTLVFAVHIRPVAAINEDVELSITPSLKTQDPPINPPESFFDVFLDISGVTGLFGFDLKVTWTDNTLITLVYADTNTSTVARLDEVWGAGDWFPAKEEWTGGGGGGGYYRLAAVSTKNSYTGTHTLLQLHFKIMRNCNFLLTTTITIDPSYKLSDSGWQPIPVHAINPGEFRMNPTKPDLEFKIVEPDSHPWEYCKTFKVEVYVTHICANLKDYNLVIEYKTELLTLTGVDWTDGVLGSDGASYTDLPVGTINVVDTGGTVWSGPRGLLFTLTFHVEFDNRIEHIWRTSVPEHHLHAFIKFTDAKLSFDPEGEILMSGIDMPADLDVIVNLIQGDVDCNGKVNTFDLRTVAAGYDKTPSDPYWNSPPYYWVKYDVKTDGTIDIYDLVVVAVNYGYNVP